MIQSLLARRNVVSLPLLCAFVLLGAALSASGTAALGAQSGSVVNINSAGLEELTLLPRVGPSLAHRIIDFRDSNGSFKKVEDLLLVQGIGEKVFERLRPYIALEGKTTLKKKVGSSG